MKVMSIIGVVWFPLCLIIMLNLGSNRYGLESALGWGVLGLLYAISLAIVGIVQSNKKNKKNENKFSATNELIQLNELKEKGILTEDEFQAKKNDLLRF